MTAVTEVNYMHRGKLRVSFIAKTFISVFFLVIIEGALRKWVSQELTNYLVLLRDAIVFYTIIWAINNRKSQLKGPGVNLLLFWSISVLIWGLFQSLVNQTNLISLLLGFRFWLLYLLFACIAAICITQYDFKVFIKFSQLTFFLMFPLVVFQHFQPSTAFINKELDSDSIVFQLTDGVVRTTGTFSFTVGYAGYISIVTPFILSLAIPGMNFWRQKWLPFLGITMVGIATLVSGSRTSILSFGAIFVIYVLGQVFFSRTKRKGFIILFLTSVVFLIGIIPVIFSNSIEVTRDRFVGAAEIESFSGRSLELLIGNDQLYQSFSFIGAGLGKGVNYAGASREGDREFLLGEYEFERNIRAGGILGLLYFGLKLCLCFLGLNKSIRILKNFGNSLPLMLWVTTLLAMIIWQITGQLSINALGFLLFGMALMSLRFPSIRV